MCRPFCNTAARTGESAYLGADSRRCQVHDEAESGGGGGGGREGEAGKEKERQKRDSKEMKKEIGTGSVIKGKEKMQ